MNTPYRLGLDLGTNSIGWTILDFSDDGKPSGIRRMGTRIFSDGRDPKSGQSLAADRTSVRSQRSRRDRAIQRRDALLLRLCKLGLLPQDAEIARNLATLDPYQLRSDALARPLHPFHFGRALMHLAKRRGFQSNRRTPGKDAEGNTKEAMRHLHELLNGQTLGQFLHQRIEQGLGARFRPKPESISKPKKDFEFYPDRAMYAAEFSAMRAAQQSHQKLTEADWDGIFRLIFFQRPLRAPIRGKCRFLPDQERASLTLPSFQQFRLLSDANNLGYRIDPFGPIQSVTPAQRTTLLTLLRTQKTVMFSKLRTAFDLPDTARFNLESDRRDHLDGDTVGYLFANKKLFGPRWGSLSLEEQDQIVTAVLDTEDHETLLRHGVKFGLLGEELDSFTKLTPEDKNLPCGTARFSAKALRQLVPHLERGFKYNEAVSACGWQHTLAAADGSQPSLPYYGQAMPDSVVPAQKSKVPDEKHYGRFPNPTVHIALNQLRLVVNTLIARYGKPSEINLELARDLKMSAKQRTELEREQTKNTKANTERDKFINWLNTEHQANLVPNYDNRLRIRLWQELSQDVNMRCCPYTGQRITPAKLFTDEVEIDHILPFAATLDDSPANKILCLRSANRIKRKQSPHEAFGHSPRDYDYGAILDRAELLPGNKRWRFQADAMTKFRDEQGFLHRQLVDTQHLGRAAHRYLTCIVPQERIRVSPGRVTALLRHHWGLETILAPADAPNRTGKNRSDHRHHAIDALVVALIDPRLLHFIRQANADSVLDRIEVPPPWPTLRADAIEVVNRIIVSHRPDHNPAGRLHEETAYGEVLQDRARRRPNQLWELDEGYNLVVRKPVAGLKRGDIEKIRDLTLRQKIASCVSDTPDTDKSAWAAALAHFISETKTQSVRLLIKNQSARVIHHGEQRFFKRLIPGNIHSVTFWRLPEKEVSTTHQSVWDANNPSDAVVTKPHPAASKLFTVHKGDVLQTIHKSELKIVRVVSLRPSEGNKKIFVTPLTDASGDSEFPIQFSRIVTTRTSPLHVSSIGDVRGYLPSKPELS